MWEYNQIYGNAVSGVLMHKDHKYIDKVRTAGGNWRYIYDTAKGGVSKAGKAVAKGIKDYNQVSNDISGQIGRNISPKVGSAVGSAAGSAYNAAKGRASKAGKTLAKGMTEDPASLKSGSAYDAAKSRVSKAGKALAKGITEESPSAKESEHRRAAQQTNASTAKAIKEDQIKRENAPAKSAIKQSLVAMKNYETAYSTINNASDFPVMYKDPKSGRMVTVTNERSKGLALRNIMNEMGSMESEINRSLQSMNPEDPEVSRYAEATRAYIAQYKKRLANSKLSDRPAGNR